MNDPVPEVISVKQWIAFVLMVVGMFMAVLDIQIVASSLKEIQAGLSATQDEISWVQSSYLIAEVMVIPICGWLSRVFSTRIVFSVSCLGFTIMSIACALSWNLNSMIIFRALQGFFGGSMIPTVFATIFTIFPLHMRPNVSVIIGLVVTVAPIAGPILGGYLTDIYSWHYLFLLNIIPGLITTIGVYRLVNFDQPNLALLKKIDYLGIILIIVFLGCLQYVLEEGLRLQWFESNIIKVASTISFFSFIMLIYQELTTASPIINLKAFRDVNFACSCVLSFALGWGLYSSVFVMPLFLGNIKSLSSVQIGQYLMVTGAFQLLSAPIAGILSKKLDLRVMLGIGFALFGLGCLLNFEITNLSGFDEFFLPQAVRGFSLMLCFLPITSLAFATLPKEEVQTASGLYNLMRNLGGAIGLALSASYLQNATKANYLGMRENNTDVNNISIDTLNAYSANLADHNYSDTMLGAVRILYQIAQREAYIISFNQLLSYIGLFLFTVVFLIFLIKKIDLSGDGNISH